jgi:hypothetical protein
MNKNIDLLKQNTPVDIYEAINETYTLHPVSEDYFNYVDKDSEIIMLGEDGVMEMTQDEFTRSVNTYVMEDDLNFYISLFKDNIENFRKPFRDASKYALKKFNIKSQEAKKLIDKITFDDAFDYVPHLLTSALAISFAPILNATGGSISTTMATSLPVLISVFWLLTVDAGYANELNALDYEYEYQLRWKQEALDDDTISEEERIKLEKEYNELEREYLEKKERLSHQYMLKARKTIDDSQLRFSKRMKELNKFSDEKKKEVILRKKNQIERKIKEVSAKIAKNPEIVSDKQFVQEMEEIL